MPWAMPARSQARGTTSRSKDQVGTSSPQGGRSHADEQRCTPLPPSLPAGGPTGPAGWCGDAHAGTYLTDGTARHATLHHPSPPRHWPPRRPSWTETLERRTLLHHGGGAAPHRATPYAASKRGVGSACEPGLGIHCPPRRTQPQRGGAYQPSPLPSLLTTCMGDQQRHPRR